MSAGPDDLGSALVRPVASGSMEPIILSPNQRFEDHAELGALPSAATIWLEKPEGDLAPLLEALAAAPQTQTTHLVIGQRAFDPKRFEFPEDPLIDADRSALLAAAFPALERLEVHGWALFDTLCHPTVRELEFRGCPAWAPGTWSGHDPDSMVFPELRSLIWNDAVDAHGLSAFEADGLAWALDRRQVPKLTEIEAPDAGADQLGSKSVKAKYGVPLARIRLARYWGTEKLAVRPERLELMRVEANVDYAALAKRYSIEIAVIEGGVARPVAG
ncbi:MAG: hypothetical protein JJ863_14525 [Deltaproteobacteria bacterium]|nr:hypothetical protein [Deltaproteobacteria bacterium]